MLDDREPFDKFASLPAPRAARVGSSPSERLLHAVEAIAAHGPLTINALQDRIGISKTATWRLVQTLRSSGWVQMRFGGSHVELSPRLDMLFSTASFGDVEFHPLIEAASPVAQERNVHVDLYAVDPVEGIQQLDTTRREKPDAQTVSDLPEHVALALFSLMTLPQRRSHVMHSLGPSATTEDVDAELTRIAHALTGFNGLSWSPDQLSLVMVVDGEMGTKVAIAVSARGGTRAPGKIAAAMDALIAKAGLEGRACARPWLQA